MSETAEAAIVLNDVTVAYSQSGTRVEALCGVHLRVVPGEWLIVVGNNGSGKSTLLRVLAGLIRPQRGSVSLFGLCLEKLQARRRASLVAYVHQRPEDGLVQGLSIAEHVLACGLIRRSFANSLQNFIRSEYFPFLESAWNRPIETLSGGERQVLGIILQLIRKTPLILLDEALTALDPGREEIVIEMLQQAAANATIVQVTHQPERIRRLATREIIMQAGRIVQ